MFSVFIRQLDGNCDELQYLAKKRWYQIQRLEQVIGQLSSLSGMDHVIQQLKVKKEELEKQQQDLLDMIQALIKIRMHYSKAENDILENSEECRVRYKYSYGVERFSMFPINSEGFVPIRII